MPPRDPQEQEIHERLKDFVFEKGAIYSPRRNMGRGTGDVRMVDHSTMTCRYQPLAHTGRRDLAHKVSKLRFAFNFELRWRAPAGSTRADRLAQESEHDVTSQRPMNGAVAHEEVTVAAPVDLGAAGASLQDLADVASALLRVVKRSGSMPTYLDPAGVELVIEEAEIHAKHLQEQAP